MHLGMLLLKKQSLDHSTILLKDGLLTFFPQGKAELFLCYSNISTRVISNITEYLDLKYGFVLLLNPAGSRAHAPYMQ